MTIEVKSNSRFSETETIVRGGKETFGRWTRPDFLKPDLLDDDEIGNFSVTSVFAGRPDLIAEEVYGDSFLEWALVMFNKPKDLLGWPKIGTVVKVVSREKVTLNT